MPTPELNIGTDQEIGASRGRYREIPIYDDTLNPDWSLEKSDFMKLEVNSTTFVKSQRVAIKATPTHMYGSLFFTVRQDARSVYKHDAVAGFSFWLNGGPNYIRPSDLVVAVVGSNAFTYWVANDTSVKPAGRITDQGSTFDETRLYFLGFEQDIPPQTWVQVTVMLDDRILDGEYKNITGFYIKNDEFFIKPFYVDRVSLLIEK